MHLAWAACEQTAYKQTHHCGGLVALTATIDSTHQSPDGFQKDNSRELTVVKSSGVRRSGAVLAHENRSHHGRLGELHVWGKSVEIPY